MVIRLGKMIQKLTHKDLVQPDSQVEGIIVHWIGESTGKYAIEEGGIRLDEVDDFQDCLKFNFKFMMQITAMNKEIFGERKEPTERDSTTMTRYDCENGVPFEINVGDQFDDAAISIDRVEKISNSSIAVLGELIKSGYKFPNIELRHKIARLECRLPKPNFAEKESLK